MLDFAVGCVWQDLTVASTQSNTLKVVACSPITFVGCVSDEVENRQSSLLAFLLDVYIVVALSHITKAKSTELAYYVFEIQQ